VPAEKPLKFTLQIESLNAGMRTREDVACLLEGAAAMLRELTCTPQVLAATLRDINGNNVGSFQLYDAVEPGEVDDDV
jgi:hypothetical protein